MSSVQTRPLPGRVLHRVDLQPLGFGPHGVTIFSPWTKLIPALEQPSIVPTENAAMRCSVS